MITDDFGYSCTETRKLPIGGGGNVICSKRGYEREMEFRRERRRDGVPFDLPKWEELEVYEKEEAK